MAGLFCHAASGNCYNLLYQKKDRNRPFEKGSIMDKKYMIGVDIGGTTIKVGLVDTDCRLIQKTRIPTKNYSDTEELIGAAAEEIFSMLQQNNIALEECIGAGIGCPGIIDSKNGTVIYANNLQWDHVPVTEIMGRKLNAGENFPVRLANDADAAALGEVHAGAAKGCSNAILLTLGTGVGGGVIFDGKIFNGPLAGGCEIGHMVIHKNGLRCSCGNRGCFEVYASKNALLRIAKKEAKDHPDSLMNKECRGNLNRMRGWIPFEAAKKGDKAAKKAISEYESNIACGVANLVNIFRPEKVIIGGGVSEQKENLTRPLYKKVSKRIYGGKNSTMPDIVTSELGNDAGIIGAACLVLE